MNTIQDALKQAVDSLMSLNPTQVKIGDGVYNVSINYANDLGMVDFSERQKSGVHLSVDDFPAEPALETDIIEVESGTVHRVKKVTFQKVAWQCDCEFRHNAHKGPFV